MQEIIRDDYQMTGRRIERDEALARYKDNPFKNEIATEIPPGEPITLYTIGDFPDLCAGGHAESTGDIGAIELMSVADAYWRGRAHLPILQLIYPTLWPTQTELDFHLTFLEHAA